MTTRAQAKQADITTDILASGAFDKAAHDADESFIAATRLEKQRLDSEHELALQARRDDDFDTDVRAAAELQAIEERARLNPLLTEILGETKKLITQGTHVPAELEEAKFVDPEVARKKAAATVTVNEVFAVAAPQINRSARYEKGRESDYNPDREKLVSKAINATMDM